MRARIIISIREHSLHACPAVDAGVQRDVKGVEGRGYG